MDRRIVSMKWAFFACPLKMDKMDKEMDKIF